MVRGGGPGPGSRVFERGTTGRPVVPRTQGAGLAETRHWGFRATGPRESRPGPWGRRGRGKAAARAGLRPANNTAGGNS